MAARRAGAADRAHATDRSTSDGAENDQANQASIAALRDELAKLGWVEERNLRIDLRFGGADADHFRAYAAELVSLAPEVIVTDTGATTRAVHLQTQTLPIVITGVGDPCHRITALFLLRCGSLFM